MLRRLHGIEIHEQSWCPATLRDAATDFLQFWVNLLDMYRRVVPTLRVALERTGARRVVDLCSGGGGPWLELHERLSEPGEDPVSVTLTDIHPNLAAYRYALERSGGAVTGREEPVDATRVPESLDGFRTLFGSFHHFRPPAARAIIEDATAKGCGIAVVDGTRRLSMLLGMPLALLIVPLVIPFMRPFRWSRLFWTYVVPLLPMIAVFDGVMSFLRCYTPEELREFADSLEGPPYEWRAGRCWAPWSPVQVTFLIGWPRATPLLRQQGRSAAAAIDEALDEADQLVADTGARNLGALILLERAELAGGLADDAARERHLRAARALFEEMSAPARVAEIDALLTER